MLSDNLPFACQFGFGHSLHHHMPSYMFPVPKMSIAPDHTARRRAASFPSGRRILLPSFAHRRNLSMFQTWPLRHQIARRQAASCLFDTQTLLPSFVHRHSLPAIQTWPSRHQIARRRAVSCLFDTQTLLPFSLRQRNLSTLQTQILRYHTLLRPEAQTPPHIRFQNVPPCLRNPCIRPNRYTRHKLSRTAHPLPPASPADSGIPESALLPQDSLSITKAYPAPSDTRPDSFRPAHTHISRLSTEPHCRCTHAVQAPETAHMPHRIL